MAYTAEISRANPTCFLFLIDQAGLIAERFGGDLNKTQAQGVADAISRNLPWKRCQATMPRKMQRSLVSSGTTDRREPL